MTTTSASAVEQDHDFRSFLRGAARLIAGRQGSAVIFAAAVLSLPLLSTRGTVTRFTWSYVGMLTLTSLLGFGFERLATTRVAERGEASVASAIRSLMVARVASLPVVAVALGLLYAFVDVRLSVAAFVATLGWILAVHVMVVASAALRAIGNVRSEPAVTVVVRSVQAALLLLLAWSGAGVVVLVGVIAVAEAVAALALCRAVGPGWRDRPRVGRRAGDTRRALVFAAIEIASLLYLRADLLLVGHLLGATAGATYALLYRFVDGAGGAVATTGLWLFSSAAAGRDGGDAYDGVRARAIRVLPRVALGLSVVGVVCAGLLGELVPRFAGETDTLRMLFAAFPLLAFNGLELYVRSARGRNAGVLMVGALALVANVGLCLWLVPTYGLVGAAGALLVAEGLQTLAIIATTRPAERRVVVPVGATVLLSTCVPAAFGVMVGSAVAAVVLAVSAFAVLAVVRVGRRVPQQVGVE